MGRPSAVDILQRNGFEIRKFEEDGKQIDFWYSLAGSAIPQQVIEAVQAAPLRDLYTVTDTVAFGEHILRAKRIVFNPKGQLIWELPDVSSGGNFVAIAAERLVLNTPNVLAEVAKFVLRPPVTSQDLKGSIGADGPAGWTSGIDDGSNGGNGQPGGTGGVGRTYDYPSIFIFFNNVTINTANPNITTALRIEGPGLQGGDGGTGGRGGRGGDGGRGTPGDRDCLLGVCVCSAGPGSGGFGGDGGPGGKGGDAGRGGNGATLIFVGPAAEIPGLERLDVYFPGAQAGLPGQPGSPAGGGSAGGGGSKPFECPQGGLPGGAGNGPNPINRGPGAARGPGVDGSSFVAIRDNLDLFT